MIEEAAGTRMYECKKISAQKTIEKKEAKLKEIQTVCLVILTLSVFIFVIQWTAAEANCFLCSLFQILDEEITPTMQKLQEVGWH